MRDELLKNVKPLASDQFHFACNQLHSVFTFGHLLACYMEPLVCFVTNFLCNLINAECIEAAVYGGMSVKGRILKENWI